MTEIPPTPPESRAFPWLKHLPEDDRREFFEELSNALGEAQLHTMPGVQVGSETYLEILEPLLASWKSTAEVHADPELYEALTRPGGFEEEGFEEAPRPTYEPMEPVRKPASKPSVRCGASLPHEDIEGDGWYWCILPMGHKGAHHEGDPAIGWHDGEVVEVYRLENVTAVPHHIHDFVGDEDTCVREPGCQLTYGGYNFWKSKWKEIQETFQKEILQAFGIPEVKIRSPRPLCSSNIPCNVTPDTSHWCALSTGHTGDHRDRTGEHTWTDEDAQRPKPWQGVSPTVEIVDEIQGFRGSDEDA